MINYFLKSLLKMWKEGKKKRSKKMKVLLDQPDGKS